MAALVASVGSFGRSVTASPSSCSTSSESNIHAGIRAAANSIPTSRISTTDYMRSHLCFQAPSACKVLPSVASGTSLASRALLGSISISLVRSHGRSGALKIFARAGGSRPPPGARRPKPKSMRPQPSDDDTRDRLPANEEITADVVMLLGEDGKLVGKMSKQEAIFRAREMDLDLVQLDKQDPPCVKIVEYSKLKYELQKRKKEQQKKSVANRMDLKELKMRYNIDVHDYGVRLKSVQKFLKDGDKVKLIIQFKGRELEFKDLGLKLFERFEGDLGEEAIVESKITKEARSISMVLAPNKGKASTTEKLNPEKSISEKKNGNEDVASVAAVGAEA